MSKKQFRSQASSSRAVSGAFGASDGGLSGGAFGSSSTFGRASPSSSISYVYEPPDLSNISAPNVVVALKNLQKKDSTTKSKALEELQAYVSLLNTSQGDVEESVLEAWIALYPRTSIDCARRVRQLAHLFQGQLFASCGKRVARSMPKIIGPWLAGLYDNDRSVSRAAQESLKQVFPSEEKLSNLWRLYQGSIIVYSLDAITKETVNTLSDERTTSPDDAAAKHTRVLATGLSLVTHIIGFVTAGDLEKHKTLLDGFLADDKVWRLASHVDAFVRRSVYKLLTAALIKSERSLDMKTISSNILASSLHIDQLGSAFDYAKAVALVTQHCPEVWTKYYSGSGKKSAWRRLCQFLKKGSRGSSPDYWSQVTTLLNRVPDTVFGAKSEDDGSAKQTEDATSLQFPILDAVHDGLCSKDEPRANLPSAWTTYLDVAARVHLELADKDATRSFNNEYLLPIVQHYIIPSNEWSKWSLPKSHQSGLALRALLLVWHSSEALMQEAWCDLSATLVEHIKTSLPEQSKGYARSQETISNEYRRWYSLQASAIEANDSQSMRRVLVQTLVSELSIAIESLKTRNGKPYGAAATVVAALQLVPDLINGVAELKDLLVQFTRDDTPNLFLSPSAPYIFTLLGLMNDKVDVKQVYTSGLKSLEEAPESTTKCNSLESVLGSDYLALADNDTISRIINGYLDAALTGDSNGWRFVLAVVKNPTAPASLVNGVHSTLIDAISTGNRIPAGIHGILLLIQESHRFLRMLVSSSDGPQLLSRLLYLVNSPNEAVAQGAQSISAVLESEMSSGKSSDQASRSRREIISTGFESPTADSLPIETLLRQARTLFEQAEDSNKVAVATAVLPSETRWREALSPFFSFAPNPSLAITNPFSCAISIIESPPTSPLKNVQSVPRDAEGFSAALRMLSYVTKLLNETKILPCCREEDKSLICEKLTLTLQLAGDQLAVPSPNGLWDISPPNADIEVANIVTETQSLVAEWMHERPEFMNSAQQRLLEMSEGRSVESYYNARAYSAMSVEMRELHGNVPNETETTILQRPSKSLGVGSLFQISALLTAASDVKRVTRRASEFLATLTDLDLQADFGEALRLLVLLNCLFYRQDDIVSTIPQQRLVFFVKHMVSQCQDFSLADPIRTEIFRALVVALPYIKELYGDFWEGIIGIIPKVWSQLQGFKDSDIPGISASLRLLAVLRALATQDSNDDLEESWTDSVTTFHDGLIVLLKYMQGVSDLSHQPQMITNELLSRQLARMPTKPIPDPQALYEVLASNSVALQQSAYRILHDHIPNSQEQISIDKALSKDYIARVPEELLSLILAAPSDEVLLDADFRRSTPAPLQSYLLSWKLVFDHWKGSSYSVQADYATALKEGEYLKNLLDFTFEHLITGRSRPVDPSKLDIMEFTPDQEDTPEKDLQYFLTHLYALSLIYVPNLSKLWWRDSTSRQTMLAVESWTEKHISPLIIASELNAVSSWGPSQADAEQPLSVKVSTSTREVTASIPIDEQTMSIAIRLPSAYPLSRAVVESIHRVGVDERKWRNWIITTQGVINFSSEGNGGSLIEGLLAWRKNVTATLKGQTECAICYSVVSAERQLPSKKCGTCRNMFHGGCLYRWFKSSNSSSCPLCRNAFNYA